jgi:predicted DNA-binding protein YlxM (UPF0122 family)
MSTLEKNIYYSNLFNFYKNLLTEKQQSIFYNYYYLDIGLTEISQELNISRQAVLDSLKKTEKLLNSYEEKLKLFKIYNSIENLVNEIQLNKNFNKLNEILKLWEE